MAIKYVVRIDNTWSEYNKLWNAIKSIRNFLKDNLEYEPITISITKVNTDRGYESKQIPWVTILRGIMWNDNEVPLDWTGSLQANIYLEFPQGVVGTPSIFTSNSLTFGFKIVLYEWSFDGGVTWQEGTVRQLHTFDTAGTYKIFLRITNDVGDVDKSKALNYVVTE